MSDVKLIINDVLRKYNGEGFWSLLRAFKSSRKYDSDKYFIINMDVWRSQDQTHNAKQQDSCLSCFSIIKPVYAYSIWDQAFFIPKNTKEVHPLPKIRTRETARDIKLFDRSANAVAHTKDALVKAKDVSDQSQDAGYHSPSEYASNQITGGAQQALGMVAKNPLKQALGHSKQAQHHFQRAKRHIDGVRKSIKTASKGTAQTAKTIKAAGRTTKTSAQTAHHTAQAAKKSAQVSTRAARVAAKTAMQAAKTSVKVTFHTIKAIIAAAKSLIAAIAAGGWVAVIIILGLLNSRANSAVFSTDSAYPLLCSLEVLGENGALKRKADMFSKRTIKPYIPITSVDTPSEALAVSLAEKSFIDLPYMAQLTGMTEEGVVAELEGIIFPSVNLGSEPPASLTNPVNLINPTNPTSPTNQTYIAANEYLSGNVREKLAQALAAQKAYPDGRYDSNVRALQSVQPADLPPGEISVRLGATWLPPEIIRQFVFELLSTPGYAQRRIKIQRRAQAGS